jgi:hypothetical protein
MIEGLSRRTGLIPPFVIAIPAIVIAVFAVIVTLAVVKLTRVVAAYSCFEVPDAFAKPFGDFRYATRAEENNYYQRDDQQLGHSKTHHIVELLVSVLSDVILDFAYKSVKHKARNQ